MTRPKTLELLAAVEGEVPDPSQDELYSNPAAALGIDDTQVTDTVKQIVEQLKGEDGLLLQRPTLMFILDRKKAMTLAKLAQIYTKPELIAMAERSGEFTEEEIEAAFSS